MFSIHFQGKPSKMSAILYVYYPPPSQKKKEEEKEIQGGKISSEKCLFYSVTILQLTIPQN